MSRGLGIVIVLLNLVVWLYFHRHVATLLLKWAKRLRLLSPLAFALVFHPAVALAFGGRSALLMLRRVSPSSILMVAMTLQFAAWLSLITLLFAALVRLVMRGVRLMKSHPARPALRPDRRRLISQAALLIPASAVSVSAAGAWASRQTPVVSHVRLPVRRELTNLHGLKLAQVSDVHVGSYMDAARLDEVARVMNALGADLHVITGDLLDNDISQLELATRFVKSLRPTRADVFACMGNHEYITARTADVASVVKGLRATGAHVLIDDVQDVVIGGDRLWMAGIDHPPGRARPEGRSTQESLRQVLAHMKDDGAPRVVLSHHPRTFVEARELPIDLMLSGHTHGGQIKLGRIGDYALTPMLAVDFYHNGLYEHHGRRLYVNAGAGGWLPVRINCPPEITLVEFVPASV
ncbi:MAG: metallophosphoesterase [Deltaproteobacteria bacterium]|nr:metallophosphoesterase [Deltaproteobacteria bacterium]